MWEGGEEEKGKDGKDREWRLKNWP